MVAPEGTGRAALHAAHPGLAAQESRDTFRRFPILKQTDQGHCVFWDERRRCGIYDLRPMACRRYPYLLDESLRAVRYASGCPSWREDGSAAEHRAYLRAVTDNHNAKLRDLTLMGLAGELLAQLGLGIYLPDLPDRRDPGPRRRFADLLKRESQRPS